MLSGSEASGATIVTSLTLKYFAAAQHDTGRERLLRTLEHGQHLRRGFQQREDVAVEILEISLHAIGSDGWAAQEFDAAPAFVGLPTVGGEKRIRGMPMKKHHERVMLSGVFQNRITSMSCPEYGASSRRPVCAEQPHHSRVRPGRKQA